MRWHEFARDGDVGRGWPARAGGATVTLSSSNTAAARVPSSVVVPAAADECYVYDYNLCGLFLYQFDDLRNLSDHPDCHTGGHGADSQLVSSSWLYRSTVSISNPGGTTLSGYQVHVGLGSGFDFTKVQASGADIRFTAGDGVTLLPFWIESWNAGSSSASLWVKVPSIPSTGATVYCITATQLPQRFQWDQHF